MLCIMPLAMMQKDLREMVLGSKKYHIERDVC